MYSQTFQIGAYQPVLRAEQSTKASKEQLAVQDGANFAWHLHGVFAAHGHTVQASQPPAADLHPASFTIGNRQVFMFNTGAYKVQGGAYVPLFQFNHQQAATAYDLTAYKWSYGFIGTVHYFSHPTVSHIIWYDEHSKQWGTYRDDCWTGPIFGICSASNRLVVQLTDVVLWSDFDEGLQFETNWYKGTGCQSMALMKYGQPYGVHTYQDGWLTFSSTGVMSSKTAAANIQDPTAIDGSQAHGPGDVSFNHEPITFDEIAAGPCAIAGIGLSQVVWLGRRGFYTYAPSQGYKSRGSLQPWQQAMGLFYAESVMPKRLKLLTRPLDDVCLNYAADLGWLFVSSKSEPNSVVYDRAHVYQMDLDKWGSFNHEHLHVGLGQQTTELLGPFYGFINGVGAYCVVDHVPRLPSSWVKFTPQKLEAPQELTLMPDVQLSVQQIRLGVSRPAWVTEAKASLRSTWFDDKQEHEHPTACHVIIAAGDDANTAVVDEQEYAHLVRRSDQISTYACHATGGVHSILITALEPEQHFDIAHVEVGFFFAGVK